MIRINLLPKAKGFKWPVVLGVDTKHIPYGMWMIFYLIYWAGDNYGLPYFEKLVSDKQFEIVPLQKRLAEHGRRGNADRDLKKQLEDFEKREAILKNKKGQVDEILKFRANPRKILEHVARSAPEKLWIDLIEIKNDKTIKLKGGSFSYTDIGDFIISLNSSPFFNNGLKINEDLLAVKNKQNKEEQFEITGAISTYDPWK